MKNKPLHKREFLNKKEGSAHYEISLNERSGGTLTIADCSRIITLDFDVWGMTKAVRKKQLKERIEKAKKLEAALESIIEYLGENSNTIIDQYDN